MFTPLGAVRFPRARNGNRRGPSGVGAVLQKERWRMSSSRWAALAAAIALVGGGCAPAISPARTAPTAVVAPGPSDLLVVPTSQGFAAFDWAAKRTAHQTPHALPTSELAPPPIIGPEGGQ